MMKESFFLFWGELSLRGSEGRSANSPEVRGEKSLRTAGVRTECIYTGERHGFAVLRHCPIWINDIIEAVLIRIENFFGVEMGSAVANGVPRGGALRPKIFSICLPSEMNLTRRKSIRTTDEINNDNGKTLLITLEVVFLCRRSSTPSIRQLRLFGSVPLSQDRVQGTPLYVEAHSPDQQSKKKLFPVKI